MRSDASFVLKGLLLLGLLLPLLPIAMAQNQPRRIVLAVDETKLVILEVARAPKPTSTMTMVPFQTGSAWSTCSYNCDALPSRSERSTN